MPRGVKDWLAGKNPALAKQRHNRKDKSRGKFTKDEAGTGDGGGDGGQTKQASGRQAGSSRKGGEAKTKDQKRGDQQRALDRRAAAAAGAAAAADDDDATTSAARVSPQTSPSGAETKLVDGKYEAKVGAADGKAGPTGQARHAGGAKPVAAGEAWLRLDSTSLTAEPKRVATDGGARQQAPTWSLANSGMAATAEGADWEVLEDFPNSKGDVHFDGRCGY